MNTKRILVASILVIFTFAVLYQYNFVPLTIVHAQDGDTPVPDNNNNPTPEPGNTNATVVPSDMGTPGSGDVTATPDTAEGTMPANSQTSRLQIAPAQYTCPNTTNLNLPGPSDDQLTVECGTGNYKACTQEASKGIGSNRTE